MYKLKPWWEYYPCSTPLPERAKQFFSKFKTYEEFDYYIYNEIGLGWHLYKINGEKITLLVFWEDYTNKVIHHMNKSRRIDLFEG